MHADSNRLAGVYLLTPDAGVLRFDEVLLVVEHALRAGVRVIQYRDKVAEHAEQVVRARRLVALTRTAGALLIVNDSVEVAVAAEADGVHLGRDDADVAEVRRRAPHLIVGVSCYNQIANASRAIKSGADAIAFGSMFASATKPAAVRAPIAMLGEARLRWPDRRVIAIGGIDAGNIAQVARAGAHAAAVLGAVFTADDPAYAALQLVQRFEEGQHLHADQRTIV